MTPTSTIGRSLAFYIKYWDHMDVLYPEGQPGSEARIRELPNPADGKAMLEKVGKRAYEQAGALIEKAALVLQKHLEGTRLCSARISSRRTKMQENWYADLQLRRRGTRARRVNHYAGVSLERVKGKPALLLYFWIRGGRIAAQALTRKIRDIVVYGPGELP